MAFVLMVPLAVTSTKGWIRRLGRRWQMLHRLVYISAIAACLHFIWKVKVAIGEPVYYAAILGLLLAFRARLAVPARAGGSGANLHAHNGLTPDFQTQPDGRLAARICPFTPALCPFA